MLHSTISGKSSGKRSFDFLFISSMKSNTTSQNTSATFGTGYPKIADEIAGMQTHLSLVSSIFGVSSIAQSKVFLIAFLRSSHSPFFPP